MILPSEKRICWIAVCNVGNLVNWTNNLIVTNDCFDLWLNRDERPRPTMTATGMADLLRLSSHTGRLLHSDTCR